MAVNEKTYSIAVVATMSAGKSSLLNALMGTELLPSQNEACTATVFKISDYDEEKTFIGRCRHGQEWTDWSSGITRETLQQWNQETPEEIELRGNLPNIANTPAGVRVCFIDTPGPNNSMCETHEEITKRAIAENDFSTLIFVINSGVAGVRDEWNLLNSLKKQITGLGKETKIVFALNKIDLLDIEKGESILDTVREAARYLEKEFGFRSPMVIPVCSKLSTGIRLAIRSAKRLTMNQLAKLTGKKTGSSYRLIHGHKRKIRKSRAYICRLPLRLQSELSVLMELFGEFASNYKEAIRDCPQMDSIMDDYKDRPIPTPTRKVYINDRFYTYRELFELDALSGIPYLEKYIEQQIFSIAPAAEEDIVDAESEEVTLEEDEEIDEADAHDDDSSEEDDELFPQTTKKDDVVLSEEVIASLPKSDADFNSPRLYYHVEFTAESAHTVSFACSANNWRTIPLEDKDGNGYSFQANLYLPAGRHYGKFLVDGVWMVDTSLPCEPDGNGDFCNVFEIINKETKHMLQVGITYNPYLVTTELTLDNEPVPQNSLLHSLTQDRLQNWIDKFLDALYEERRDKSIVITFKGTEWDSEDVASAIDDFKTKNPDFDIQVKMDISKIKDDERLTKLHDLFEEGKQSPFGELFNSERMKEAFARATDPTFEVNVIATMSSGKSTVVNALLGKELMPAKNEACTATIARIEDDDNNPEFVAQRFDREGKPLSELVPATRELLTEWNDDVKTHLIEVKGDIPTVKETSACTFVFVDTPGPNNARTAAHEQATLEAIQSKPLSMVLYILNATQLSTKDDDQLLKLVCNEMNKGGRKAHDRFVFIANKIDAFDPEKGESVTKAMVNVRAYLREHGIMNPIVIPASAQLAKILRLPQEGLTRKERASLAEQIMLFTEEPEMNMLEHSKGRLSASCARRLEERLAAARKDSNDKKVAELLSGIPIVEELLNEFLQKHALPAKLKDAVDTFNRVMQESDVAKAMNEQLDKSEKELADIVESVKRFTDDKANVQKADNFRKKVRSIHYALSKDAKNACAEIGDESEKIIEDMIKTFTDDKLSKKEAEHIVEDVLQHCQSLEAQVNVTLNEALKNEYLNVIGQLREEYQTYVYSIINENFPDNTSMQELQKASMSLPSVSEMIMDYSYTASIKTRTERVKVGTELVEDGTEDVKVGSEMVPDGQEQYIQGYKTERYGFLWLKKREVPVYAWRDKFVKKDIYETRTKYKKQDVYIDQDIVEEREFVNMGPIAKHIAATIREFANSNIRTFQNDATNNVEQAKKTLLNVMDAIDEKVKDVTRQLEEASKSKEEKERLIKENREKVEWYNSFKEKINSVLAI